VNQAKTRATAERVEGRPLAKGNPRQQNTLRTPDRVGVPSALERIGRAAKKDKKVRFTTLMHHVYNVDQLREAYFSLKRDAAAGVDGETWRSYGEQLEEHLSDLSARLKRGAYRARPVRRTYIPKASGGQRPLGVTALEDKLVQRAVVRVLNEIYERDFLGFSYGFRPKRNPHNALDALCVGIERRRVNWVLDADIRRYFDSIDHGWLRKFVEHRIADQRIVRLIMKWLKAGVLEEGQWTRSDEGTPQGGVISPLLANIFLHYVFDLWADAWRRHARGDVIIVRYADDFVVGFEHEAEAQRFWNDLKERFLKFGLELHPEKTRLIEFGRYTAVRRERAGLGKPATFDFLGFTHISGKTRDGRPTVLRQTSRKRLKAKLREVKTELMRRRHDPVPRQGMYLRDVLRGHYNYYGVPMNDRALKALRHHLARPWKRALSRRSQKGRVSWERVGRLVARYLPHPRICHPFPSRRLNLNTRGKSPVQ
jgi:group II intron reverse transcriptase/maturase